MEGIIPIAELSPFINCIETVVKHGFAPRFALVYDEFYQLMARLDAVLSPILGAGYYLVPDEFEVYFIENADSQTGTGPHRDSLEVEDSIRDDGRPALINVWIPFTDVSALNSCIHVLPAHLDPYFERFGHFKVKDHRPRATGEIPMQDIRALPATAGSVLAWTPHLLHCGSRSSKRASNPRISFAVYFQSSDVRPFHKFTMKIPGPLPFRYRLYLIEKLAKDRDAKSNDFREFQELWHQANAGN